MDVSKVPIPYGDMEENYISCAVVAPAAANGLAGQGTGPSIDAHEAVLRFDGKSSDSSGMSESIESAESIGTATALRFVSRGYAQELADGQVAEESLASSHLIFWDSAAWPLMPSVHARYPEASLHIPSSALVRWQAVIMHQMRADLARLGLGPFACNGPGAASQLLSEAMQGVLLASLLCPSVNTFGLRPLEISGPSPTGPEARPFSSLRDRQIASRNRPLQAPPGKSTARSWCLGRLPSCLGSRC
ncbi:hypothetical protein WJX84_008993 [Apatococcus fuscideae]|uniref:Uncharacterized protein n=1 Tax=Apatococcus fuscideae TaxID=2026836 RepID=A0AAW1SVZ7_9CHLO